MPDVIINALDLLFGNTGQLPGNAEFKPLSFAIASSGMGLVIVLLDVVAFLTLRRSYLKLAHGFPKSIRLAILWGVGAGLGGFLGAGFEVLQLNRLACVTVGVSWPLILPRVIKSAGEDELQQKEIEEEAEK